jgi:Cu/Ag efflux protein CusF
MNHQSKRHPRSGIAAAACVLAALLAAVSCGDDKAAPPGKVHHAVGVVVVVSPETSSIKIDHEEIKDFMPAMSMKFVVRDKTLLNDVKPNDRVEFDVVEATEGYVITAIKKSGP